MKPDEDEAPAQGPILYDRRTGRKVVETVLGGSWLEWAYRGPLRKLLGPLLFRRALASRLCGWYADTGFSRRRIARVIQELDIDVGEFRDPISEFRTFNEFFYRHLRPDARPFDPSPEILVSPADCRLLVFPSLQDDTCIPVKGSSFTLGALFGPDLAARAEPFRGGSLAVCRLCPADYHRYHYPASGRATTHASLPGAYHSVNPVAIALGLDIFTENRREISLLDLDGFGPCAFIEVGAFGVGGIVQTHTESTFAKQDEKGYFTFGGSTLILVFAPGAVQFDADLVQHSAEGFETRVLCGETIGRRPSPDSSAEPAAEGAAT